MKRIQKIKNYLSQTSQPRKSDDRSWDGLCRGIRSGQVIPVVSGSLFYDLIFRNISTENCGEDGQEDEPLPKPTVENMLAENWAEDIEYKLPDRQDLARVAQFLRSEYPFPVTAKNEYLRFLKETLLNYALQTEPRRSRDQVEPLFNGIDSYTFSDLAVRELDLLRFGAGCCDPLTILAGLPLPIYITTSYHDILELALQAVGKEPVTQVCFWPGKAGAVKPGHEPLKRLAPSITRPLVYHLYGMDQYPLSLVLTEDDYLDFLIQITLGRNKGPNSVIPDYLRATLSTSSLLLLGYRLQDWDFRTLFRGLINTLENHASGDQNTIIQLSLDSQYDHPERDEALHNFFGSAQGYLQGYFKTMSFEIRWCDPCCFLTDLHNHWRISQV